MPVQVINGVGIAGIGTGSSSQSGGGSSVDSDAQSFITAASLTSTTQTNAIIDLVLDLKAAGLWTKITALYPMVGGTASSHKFNLKDPRDLNAAYRLVFNGGWTHSSTGAKPNGTTGYANTNLIPISGLTNANTHMSFYNRTNSPTTVGMGLISSYNAIDNRWLFEDYGNLIYSDHYQYSGNRMTSNGSYLVGFWQTNRISTSHKIMSNGGVVASSSTSALGFSALNFPIFLGAYNYANTSYGGPKSGEIALSSIGSGFTDTEAQVYYQIVEKFQYALGRNSNSTKSFYYNKNYSNEVNAFIFNGGITGSTEMSATNTLVSDLKAAGLWDKMQAIYPMVGGTATAHRLNLKTPGTFNITFTAGWTHTSTGAKSNGTNAYANTGWVPSSNVSAYDSHISFYSRTDNSNNGMLMGCQMVGTAAATRLQISGRYIYGTVNSSAGASNALNIGSSGHFIISRNGGNTLRLNKNTSGTTTYAAYFNLPNQSLLIGAYQDNGGINNYSDKECAFASMGTGLSDLEMNIFSQIVENFQSALGRSVTTSKSIYFNSNYGNELNNFLYNTQITNTTQVSALNTLVTTLKTANIWSKLYAIYPMIGGTSETHRYNLYNVGGTLTFNGGWSHSSSGATPNGTNAYTDGIYGVSVNNAHVSYYSLTSESGNADFGAAGGNHSLYAFIRNVNSARYIVTTYLAESSFSNTDGKGYYIVNRTSSTQQIMFKNKVKNVGNVNSSSAPSDGIKFGAYSNNGGVFSYGNKTCAFATIGYGLTDAESNTLTDAVQAFQTTLGRQV